MAERTFVRSAGEMKANARRLSDELLTQGDLAVADEILSTDCQHHTPCGIGPGVAGVKQWVREFPRAFPDLHAIVEAEIAEGDMVVQRLTLSGTHRGEYCNLPPTWPTHQMAGCVAIQRLGCDGKVVEQWATWDRLGVLRQFG